jgi:Glycosyltransferase like family 2
VAVSNELLHGLEPEWCIAVFARNEQERIGDCLTAIASAVQGVRAHVMLIINGSSDHTRATALALLPRFDFSASVYTIQTACKAHAMNEFIHKLRPKAEIYFFIDATAFVEPDALQALTTALRHRPDIMAVSGLPINGRGAAKMREGASHTSKLFGQMFAVRQSCLDAIASLGRRLPIGLYRCDGLFAGFICWETNGIAHEWAMPRIATIPDAQWRVRPISWLRLKDVKAGFNRLVRQGRGRLENQAWNPILWTQGFGALPRYAEDMILEWLKTNRPRKEPRLDQFFTWLALRRIRRWRRPDEAALLPQKIL